MLDFNRPKTRPGLVTGFLVTFLIYFLWKIPHESEAYQQVLIFLCTAVVLLYALVALGVVARLRMKNQLLEKELKIVRSQQFSTTHPHKAPRHVLAVWNANSK